MIPCFHSKFSMCSSFFKSSLDLRDNIRNLHSLAPELGDANLAPDTPVDIYAFGMCALETAALEINGK